MKRWWVSWYQPTEDIRPLHDPPMVVAWWRSGESDEGSTICAVVDAPNMLAAQRLVQRDWPEAKKWRFIEERDEGWMPSTDRFPT